MGRWDEDGTFNEPGEDGDIEQVIHEDGIHIAKKVAQHILRVGKVDRQNVGRVIEEVADPVTQLRVTNVGIPKERGHVILPHCNTSHCR